MQNAVKDIHRRPTSSTEIQRSKRSDSLKGTKENIMEKETSEMWVQAPHLKMEMRVIRVGKSEREGTRGSEVHVQLGIQCDWNL